MVVAAALILGEWREFVRRSENPREGMSGRSDASPEMLTGAVSFNGPIEPSTIEISVPARAPQIDACIE
jgi:hypothetical protein